MRTPNLFLLPIFCLIFSVHFLVTNAESNSETVNDEPYVVNLKGKNSSVHFHQKYPWVLQGLFVKDVPVHKWEVELKYHTWSERGRMLTVVADSPQGFNVFMLEICLFNGMINLKLIDEDGKLLMNEDSPTTIITDVPHEGTIKLEVDAENSAINFNENIYIIGGKLFISEEQHDLDMKLFVGRFRDSPSIIGCIELTNFGDLSTGKKEIPEVISTNDISLNCPGIEQDAKSEESEKVFKLDTSVEANNETVKIQVDDPDDTKDLQRADERFPFVKEPGGKGVKKPGEDEAQNEVEPKLPFGPRPPGVGL